MFALSEGFPPGSEYEPEDVDVESEEQFKERLTNTWRQMMFVSGETAEPSVETTTLIEEIVRQQVVEIVRYLRRFLQPVNDANIPTSLLEAPLWQPAAVCALSPPMI